MEWVGGACSFARKKLCTSRICGISVLTVRGGSGRGGGRADGRFEVRALEKGVSSDLQYNLFFFFFREKNEPR